MAERCWTDDELRAFLTQLRSTHGFFSTEPFDETARAAFLRQVSSTVVPEVQRRLLASIGAPTSASGLAEVCFEVAEEATHGPEHTWLMASAAPWRYFTDLVVERIEQAHREAKGSPSRKALDGIEAASSRRAIGG